MSKLKVSAIHDPDNDNQAISIDSSGNITAPQNATISGTATVTGTTTLSGNASIGGNATITGTATVTGNASFNGDITANAGTITGSSFSGSGASLTSLNASNLGSGTVPDARFPSALPAISGASLTSLNASNLGSGTIPDARFPSALPAIDGSALTGISGGGGSLTPYISVRMGSGMTANGSYQKLQLNTEDFDSDGDFDTTNYRWTPSTAGKYFVICRVNTDSSATGSLTHTLSKIYKNGSAITGASGYMDLRGTAGVALNAVATIIVSMNGSTDYLEFYGYGAGSATHYLRSGDTGVQAWKIE